MAFFSGLKAAYDSIGSEITKTFDSSKGNVEKDSTTASDQESAAILEVNSSPPPQTGVTEVTREELDPT